MTKTIGLAAAMATTLLATSSMAAAQWGRNDNRVFMDGHVLHFSPETHPYWSQGTLLVPARALAGMLGATMGRNASGDRIWLQYGPKRLEFKKGHVDYWINGERLPLATTSEDHAGIMFVPIALFTNLSMNRIRFDRHGDRNGN